ncbi:hypothetical protein KKI23_00765 [Patescibacteria group bacterium]|nr:hypothetical protein [Patescibacteria group bacterium]
MKETKRVDQNKLAMVKQMIDSANANLQAARQMIIEMAGGDLSLDHSDKAKEVGSASVSEEGRIVEGVFDGQGMVGPDGKEYSIPSNYASKSKLIEGDTLKLTITSDGSFIYKQIGPIDRQRMVGVLTKDDTTGDFTVLAGGKAYQVLLASVTYFKGEPGDEAIILVPKEGDSTWAAVENVVKKNQTE